MTETRAGLGTSVGVSFFPREGMSHAGPLSRNLVVCTFLQEHGLQAVDPSPPGVTSLLQYYDPNPYG